MLGINESDRQTVLPQKAYSASHSDFKDWVNSLFSSMEIKRPRVIPTENFYEHISANKENADIEEESLETAAESASVFNAPKTVNAATELEELLRGGALEGFSA